MNDLEYIKFPSAIEKISLQTEALGFQMASEPQTGSLLRTLAACKPNGKFLEIGTGTGYGTAWILQGMDSASTLDTVDINAEAQAIARENLIQDKRVSFFLQDAIQFLTEHPANSYDFIFADTFAGKFERLDLTLGLLKTGGILVLDDLLSQKNWPEGHDLKVEKLLEQLDQLTGFQVLKLSWATGIVILTKVALPN